jgi:hypothetical protein
MRMEKGYQLLFVPSDGYDPAEAGAEAIPDAVNKSHAASPSGYSPPSLRIDSNRPAVENWTIAILTCIALLTFFFPLMAMHMPIAGDQRISGYDVVSKTLSLTEELDSNPQASVGSSSAAPGINLSLSLQMVWLIPLLS